MNQFEARWYNLGDGRIITPLFQHQGNSAFSLKSAKFLFLRLCSEDASRSDVRDEWNERAVTRSPGEHCSRIQPHSASRGGVKFVSCPGGDLWSLRNQANRCFEHSSNGFHMSSILGNLADKASGGLRLIRGCTTRQIIVILEAVPRHAIPYSYNQRC